MIEGYERAGFDRWLTHDPRDDEPLGECKWCHQLMDDYAGDYCSHRCETLDRWDIDERIGA